ncbi:uncharacterized protein LOC136095355 [Hydra vulgaris]|uniref:uncharacterized protein LOC136095355 n=1 Tax=Hydra vulgaris TaxID=6087 RepID=UPI0032EA0986
MNLIKETYINLNVLKTTKKSGRFFATKYYFRGQLSSAIAPASRPSLNKINHPFNTEKKLAGRDFIVGFLKRQPFLSIRKPEAVSINRVFGLNKAAVQRYFDNLEKLINENQFEANRIYNCDESGLTCVHKPLKVIAHKGQCVVSSTTVILAFNCVGHYILPIIIFKRKRVLDSLIDDAPPGTIGRCSKSGWVDTNLFMDFIRHFVIHGNCSTTNKCLLILDGHKLHTKNLDLLNYASINRLHILSLPPHTSHKLQPIFFLFFFFYFYSPPQGREGNYRRGGYLFVAITLSQLYNSETRTLTKKAAARRNEMSAVLPGT